MTYQETAAKNAYAAEAAVVAAYTALGGEDFTEAAASLVARANVRAAALADLSLAVMLAKLPLGLGRPIEDLARLARVLTEITKERETARMRVARIGRAEPLEAGREAYSEAMTRHEVVGWRRQLNEGACQLCTWWAQDGKVFPVETRMRSHPGCRCVAEVVT